jgi:hypothetical protein
MTRPPGSWAGFPRRDEPEPNAHPEDHQRRQLRLHLRAHRHRGPHAQSLSDSVPKLKGLATYAKDHGDEYQRIESIIKINDVFPEYEG